MPRPPRSRRWMTAVALASTTWSSVAPAPLLRADDRPSPGSPAAARGDLDEPQLAEEELKIRMTYVSASWDYVLNDLARKTGSTLVMHATPPGRYTRNDWRSHSKTEAIHILNDELEQRGYRILETGQFLTVIETTAARTEYARREYQPTPEAGQPEPADRPATARAAALQKAIPLDRAALTRPRSQTSGVVQVAFADDGETAPSVPAALADEVETETFRPQRSAVDLARHMFQAFRKRAELIDDGPTELPGFEVYRANAPVKVEGNPLGEPERPVWLTVEIDSDKNELLIHGGAAARRGAALLFSRLDAIPVDDRRPTKLVPGTPGMLAVADRLSPELQKLIAARRELRGAGGAVPPANDPLAAMPGRDHLLAQAPEAGPQPPVDNAPPAADPNQPAGDAAAQPGNPLTPEFLGNLRGDVAVEALPDLDLLIIRGNEKDVDQVMQVIRAIEEMAAGATPEIHLLFLQHVNSNGLAELLNDVYERMGELNGNQETAVRRTRSINVVAVGKPNAVLILAPQFMMESVLQLAQELDQPVSPGTQLQVFRLKSAVATQVTELITEFYEERPGLETTVEAVADVRTNSVIVHGSPAELAEVEQLIRKIDRDEAGAVNKARVFPLKNAVAEELATFLNTVIQGVLNPSQTAGGIGGFGGAGAQASQELRDTKSVVLEFLSDDGMAQRLVRSGLLSDVRITADPRTNSLMVTASEASLPLLEELIRVLDQPSSAVADIKVFTLKNADAVVAGELLQSLFPEPEEGEAGVQVAGATGTSSLIPLRVSVDPRTNSVIAVGGAEVLRVVDAILFRLDASDTRDRQTEVLRLRNSPAIDVATAINQFLQSQRDLLTLDPDRVSTSELLEQEIIVTPEPVSNNLLISATPAYFDQIKKIAEDLDRAPAQVVIQALIVEVTLDNTDEFGLELGFQDSVLFNRSLKTAPVTINQTTTLPTGAQTTTQQIISQSATPGFLFNNQTLGNNVGVNTSQVGTQGLSNFALGRTNSDLGFGGLVLSASSESVSVLLRALSAHREVNILSRPQIIALDNQIASIQVGQQVPIVNGVVITNNIANPTIEQQEAGIILTVTPRISPDGQVVMEVVAEKSQFRDGGVPIFTDVNTGNVVTSPIKDITTARTSLKVPDGQTIVVGGMITKTDDVTERKIPWFGDIPILGNAFRYDLQLHTRTELLIFLTPRIVHQEADMEFLKRVEMERLHFFEQDAETVHGPLRGVPSAMSAPLELPPIYEVDPQQAYPPAGGQLITPPAPPAAPAPPAQQPIPIPPQVGTTPSRAAVVQLEDWEEWP